MKETKIVYHKAEEKFSQQRKCSKKISFLFVLVNKQSFMV